MLQQHLHKPVRNEMDHPLNADETLLHYFGQRAYQIVITAIRQTKGGTCGSIGRYYLQALPYLEGIDWMIRYGEIDPRTREQAKVGIEASQNQPQAVIDVKRSDAFVAGFEDRIVHLQ